MTTPEGWYPDPQDSTKERRWDGANWTHDVRLLPPPDLPPPDLAPPDLPPPPASSDEEPAQPEGASRLKRVADAAASYAGEAVKGPTGGDTYGIAEDGKNGTITFGAKGLDRDIKKLVGKNDRQFIPYASVSMVSHDRKRVGRDIVVVHVGNRTYDWKIQTDAEGFVNRLNGYIA